MITEITISAIIHPSIALTSPRPIPKIVTKMSPAQSIKLSSEKPVVAKNRAEDDAIIAFISFVLILVICESTFHAYIITDNYTCMQLFANAQYVRPVIHLTIFCENLRNKEEINTPNEVNKH